jgi:Antp family, other
MNSYFEQSSFYGAQGSEQPYRFPLSLGMSPYAQHHHQSRPQDSPYDASAAAAAAAAVASCKLYSSQMQSAAETVYKSAADGKTSSNSSSDQQNGYAAALAAATATSKSDIAAWPTASGVPVRPAACTPDRYSSGAGGANGLVDHPAVTTSPSAHRPLNWNNCSLNTSAVAVSQQASQLQQSSNHTFYPWMAIAGTGLVIPFCFSACWVLGWDNVRKISVFSVKILFLQCLKFLRLFQSLNFSINMPINLNAK